MQLCLTHRQLNQSDTSEIYTPEFRTNKKICFPSMPLWGFNGDTDKLCYELAVLINIHKAAPKTHLCADESSQDAPGISSNPGNCCDNSDQNISTLILKYNRLI